MEYENENENKVGAGILTICILHFIGALIGIASFFLTKSAITPEITAQTGVTSTSLVVSLIVTTVYAIACILLLLKQKIGIFLYYIVALTNLITTFAFIGFSFLTLGLSLILPILMAIFILKKKEVYGFGTK